MLCLTDKHRSHTNTYSPCEAEPRLRLDGSIAIVCGTDCFVTRTFVALCMRGPLMFYRRMKASAECAYDVWVAAPNSCKCGMQTAINDECYSARCGVCGAKRRQRPRLAARRPEAEGPRCLKSCALPSSSAYTEVGGKVWRCCRFFRAQAHTGQGMYGTHQGCLVDRACGLLWWSGGRRSVWGRRSVERGERRSPSHFRWSRSKQRALAQKRG